MTTMQAAFAPFVAQIPMVAEYNAIKAKKGWTHAQKFAKEKKREAATIYSYDPTLWDQGRLAKLW